MNQDYKQTLWILQQLPVLVSGLAPRAAKDVTEYMKTHSIEDLVRLIGADWIRMPDGTTLEDPCAESPMLNLSDWDLPDGEIPC
jgi:hypothetical protein